MRPEREPEWREIAAAGVAAIRTIDRRDEASEEALLAAFLCAAWPSFQAQNQ
jgi:hypothetical protein